MQKKKTVIFNINSREQFFGEFHENTKIRMMKSYFKDVSHINNFRFFYNGESINNDEISLKDLSSKSTSQVLIKVSIYNSHSNNELAEQNVYISDLDKNGRSGASVINCGADNQTEINFHNHQDEIIKENYELNSHISELNIHISSIQEENSNLIKEINELNLKLITMQKAYEITLNQNFNSNRMIEQIKLDYENLLELHKKTSERLNRIENSPRKKSSLVERKRSSLSYPKKNSLNENKESITNFDYSKFPNRRSLVNPEKRTIMQGDSSIRKSIVKQRPDNADNGITKNENYNMETLKKSHSKFTMVKNVKTNSDSPWNTILLFLDKFDQSNLLQANKNYFKIVSNFWYDCVLTKLDNINKTLEINKNQYDKILENQQFQLSVSANTALKILNNSKYMEVFTFPESYFDNFQLICVYRLLFQFTHIVDDNLIIDNLNFIKFFRQFFIENSKGGLGELIKSLSKLCDFNDLNIEKIEEILRFYNMPLLDCGSLGKLCKTTGIIAFFVKDALIFCGLEDDRKHKDDKNRTRPNVIKDNIDIKKMKRSSLTMLKKIDDNLVKYKI